LQLDPDQVKTMIEAEFGTKSDTQALCYVHETNETAVDLFLSVSGELKRDLNGHLSLDKVAAGEIIDRLGLDFEPVDYRKLMLMEVFVIESMS
jgi:hypothetical protein